MIVIASLVLLATACEEGQRAASHGAFVLAGAVGDLTLSSAGGGRPVSDVRADAQTGRRGSFGGIEHLPLAERRAVVLMLERPETLQYGD
jgi:hypothetical protein